MSMNKIELITIIRGLINEELRNPNFLRSIIVNVIKEEVRKETNKLLTEMEETQISDTSLVKMVSSIPAGSEDKLNGLKNKIYNGRKENLVKKKEIAFTKNKKLNALLNETYTDLRSGNVTLPVSDTPDTTTEQWPTMQYNKDPRSFSHAKTLNVSPGMEKSVGAMIPSVDVEGNPMAVNPDTLPDHVRAALTRNYRPLMKKLKEKEGA